MTTTEYLQIAITLVTAIIAPMVALYVRATVDTAVKKQEERFTRFELSFTKTMGEQALHYRESELRHTANEKRIAFLEVQWEAYQERANQQQRFQGEIVTSQETIAKILQSVLQEVLSDRPNGHGGGRGMRAS